MRTDSSDGLRWQAVLDRDAAADGTFVYSVVTTGVFCRPSCPARRPRRDNVAFHDTADLARQAGYRACKRCRPEGPTRLEEQRATITALCAYIDDAASLPDVAELADRAGWSVSHLHRVFRALVGLTPRAYVAGRRADRLRERLDDATSITDAIYDAGYPAPGRFYAESDALLGMTPKAFRGGGRGETIRFAVAQGSLGAVLVAATTRGVCAVLLGDDAEALVEDLQARFAEANLEGADPSFDATVAIVVGLVDHPGDAPELPLDLRGTAFQRRVWRALTQIPAGETRTYTEIAAAIGSPRSSRAVAGACAANPVAVIVPCHRVVRADGGLSGYRWGIDRKRTLLQREARDVLRLF